MNLERKMKQMLKAVDDFQRLLKVIEGNNVPGLHRLLVCHRRNGGAVESFIDKCHRVVDLRKAGDAAFRRKYIQRATFKDGKMDSETYCIFKLTVLMMKLGCR